MPCCGSSQGCHKVPGAVCPAIGSCPRAGQAKCYRTDDGPQAMGLIGVWPSDVDAIKRSVDPSMVATDLAVRRCAEVSPAEMAAWGGFYAAWRSFHDEATPWMFGTGAKYDEGLAYRAQLGGWQELLRSKCTIPGPHVSSVEEGAAMSSAIRWGAAAVIAVAVVYGVRTVVR